MKCVIEDLLRVLQQVQNLVRTLRYYDYKFLLSGPMDPRIQKIFICSVKQILIITLNSLKHKLYHIPKEILWNFLRKDCSSLRSRLCDRREQKQGIEVRSFP